MRLCAHALITLIAVLHLGFLVLEMFFWTKPLGLRVFRQSIEQAQASATLAANQGLYNGFLAAGLFWGLIHPTAEVAYQLKVFFLGCVLVAGVYGAISVNKRILFVQALPAVIALALVAAGGAHPS